MRKTILHSFLAFTMSLSLLRPTQLSCETISMTDEHIVKVETTTTVYEPFNEVEIVNMENLQIKTTSIEEVVEPEPEPEPIPEEPKMSEEDIRLIALVTMAEAEGESEYGKRLVIDTILNRVDHEWSYWPDTVKGVIYQKGQFTSMWNGRVDRCYVRDDIVQLVKEELENRTNNDVVYFMMGKYSKYGTPLFKEGCHYFSSY